MKALNVELCWALQFNGHSQSWGWLLDFCRPFFGACFVGFVTELVDNCNATIMPLKSHPKAVESRERKDEITAYVPCQLTLQTLSTLLMHICNTENKGQQPRRQLRLELTMLVLVLHAITPKLP